MRLSKDGSPHVTDERWNTILHLLGAIYALLLSVLLIAMASAYGKPWHIVSFSIYGLSLCGLFISSTLHHGINDPRWNSTLRIMDYCGVFLLIAGTFTPLCLVLVGGVLGWSILGIVWGLAAIGILLKITFPAIPKWVTNTLYVSMGWLSLAIAGALWDALPRLGFMLILLGGCVYTIGSFIYLFERPNLVPGIFGFHELWHVLVLIGACLHGILLYWYVLPY